MNITSGNSIRDENIKNSKEFLNSTFFDDGSFNPNITLWNTDLQLRCRITDIKKSTLYGTTSKVQILINDSLNIGDIIYDNAEKIHWICVEIHVVGDVIKQGTLAMCNYTLKFQSSDGTILSYPCIDSTNSVVGVDENKVISTGSAIHTIKLPFDENTVLINTNDRFIIDDPAVDIPQVFSVSKPNRTEFKYGDKGLIELTMKQDEYSSTTDRKDLGVCNYFEIDTPNPPSGDGIWKMYLTVKGSNVIKTGGNKKIITAQLVDENGENILSSEYSWSVSSNIDSYLKYTTTNNVMEISVSGELELSGDKITITVRSVKSGHTNSLTLTVELGGI